MNKLKQEYVLQIRNTLFAFLHLKLGLTVDIIGDVFGVDKSTVSRAIRSGNTDKKMLIDLAKYFK
jgi:predicted transcriptional regulator